VAYFKITGYAGRLLDDLSSWRIVAAQVLAMQRNWMGSLRGGCRLSDQARRGKGHRLHHSSRHPVRHVTFMVVAPDSDLAAELVAGSTDCRALELLNTTSFRCRTTEDQAPGRQPQPRRRPASSSTGSQ
jgi:leucyl-tRNA synthetase